MHRTTTPTLAETIRDAAHPLTGAKGDYDPLLELIGDAISRLDYLSSSMRCSTSTSPRR